MKNKFIKLGVHAFAILALFLSLFNVTFAAPTTFSDLVDMLTGTLASSIIKLIFALAFIYFLWGVVQYGFSEEETKKEKGKQLLLWGIIGLTVMFSVYGLIRILGNTLELF